MLSTCFYNVWLNIYIASVIKQKWFRGLLSHGGRKGLIMASQLDLTSFKIVLVFIQYFYNIPFNDQDRDQLNTHFFAPLLHVFLFTQSEIFNIEAVSEYNPLLNIYSQLFDLCLNLVKKLPHDLLGHDFSILLTFFENK